MKTSFRHCFATVLLVAPVVGFGACANRGMEAAGNPLSDGGPSLTGGQSGGAGGVGGHLAGTGGAVNGGSGGHGSGGAGGNAGNLGTGGGTGGTGTGGTGTGGTGTGGTGTGGTGTGGTAGGTGGVSTGGSGGGTGGAGTGGAAGRGGQGGAGGMAGRGGAIGQGGVAGSGPVIISIDFVGGRPAASGGADVPAPAMEATETAGVKPAMNWNSAESAMGTLANLRGSDGSATVATIMWSSPSSGINLGDWTNLFTDAPGDTRMMNGYLDPTGSASPATVKVTGLAATIAGGYDVYVYCLGQIPQAVTRTYQYNIGSTNVTVSQTGPTTATFPGFTLAPSGGSGNYILFRRVSGTAFTLMATPGTGDETRAPINGIQIVWPSGS